MRLLLLMLAAATGPLRRGGGAMKTAGVVRLAAFVFAASLALAPPSRAAEDYSPAERALFMTDHLAGLKAPGRLAYTYRKSGSLEPGFDDRIELTLNARPGGACCSAQANFLSGARRLALPEVDTAQGNPVVLYFLERDIREMQRLTKGQPNYFRKRIRMAVYQGATVRDVMLPWGGREVAGREITIAPYLDDPLRARFESLAVKRYVFTLSEAVPGGIYALRSQVAGPTPEAAPLVVEELRLDAIPALPSDPPKRSP
jgi:hypothetical protein